MIVYNIITHISKKIQQGFAKTRNEAFICFKLKKRMPSQLEKAFSLVLIFYEAGKDEIR